MKKILLFVALATFSLTSFGQAKVWNFSLPPFGEEASSIDFNTTQVIDGLTIGTNGEALFSLDANKKSLDGIDYTHRLKTGGGGAPAEGSLIPTTRYLKIDVAGDSEINIAMMASSSSATRVLVVVNSDETHTAEIPDVIGSSIANYTHNYKGGPTSLYFYSQDSGINFYSFSATNLATSSVKQTNAGKRIISEKTYNVLGHEIPSNSKGLVIRKITFDDGSTQSVKNYIRWEK